MNILGFRSPLLGAGSVKNTRNTVRPMGVDKSLSWLESTESVRSATQGFHRYFRFSIIPARGENHEERAEGGKIDVTRWGFIPV